jgi:hypothetical protein
MENNLFNKIEEFFNLYYDIVKDKDKVLAEVGRYDKEVSKTYHKIEGMGFGHVCESHKLLKEFQILLKERREAKGNARIMQMFYGGLKTKIDKSKISINNGINRHNAIIDEIKERAKAPIIKKVENVEENSDFIQKTLIFKEVNTESIVKYLNRQYLLDNGFIIHDEFYISKIKGDLKPVFGENILNEFDIFDDWLYILFPDKVIKIKNSDGTWYKRGYDSNGNELTYEKSSGYWYKSTFDSNGNQLTFENSNGTWYKRGYDSNGNQLTYENSIGIKENY